MKKTTFLIIAVILISQSLTATSPDIETPKATTKKALPSKKNLPTEPASPEPTEKVVVTPEPTTPVEVKTAFEKKHNLMRTTASSGMGDTYTLKKDDTIAGWFITFKMNTNKSTKPITPYPSSSSIGRAIAQEGGVTASASNFGIALPEGVDDSQCSLYFIVRPNFDKGLATEQLLVKAPHGSSIPGYLKGEKYIPFMYGFGVDAGRAAALTKEKPALSEHIKNLYTPAGTIEEAKQTITDEEAFIAAGSKEVKLIWLENIITYFKLVDKYGEFVYSTRAINLSDHFEKSRGTATYSHHINKTTDDKGKTSISNWCVTGIPSVFFDKVKNKKLPVTAANLGIVLPKDVDETKCFLYMLNQNNTLCSAPFNSQLTGISSQARLRPAVYGYRKYASFAAQQPSTRIYRPFNKWLTGGNNLHVKTALRQFPMHIEHELRSKEVGSMAKEKRWVHGMGVDKLTHFHLSNGKLVGWYVTFDIDDDLPKDKHVKRVIEERLPVTKQNMQIAGPSQINENKLCLLFLEVDKKRDAKTKKQTQHFRLIKVMTGSKVPETTAELHLIGYGVGEDLMQIYKKEKSRNDVDEGYAYYIYGKGWRSSQNEEMKGYRLLTEQHLPDEHVDPSDLLEPLPIKVYAPSKKSIGSKVSGFFNSLKFW